LGNLLLPILETASSLPTTCSVTTMIYVKTKSTCSISPPALYLPSHWRIVFWNDESSPSKLQHTITIEDLNESELLYSQLLDTDDSPKFNPAAQSAADPDNLHSAFQHLDNSHPVAFYTDDEAMAYVKAQLFPDPPVNDEFPLPNNKATSPATRIPSKPLAWWW
jgi:hypothetical protein